MGDTPITEQLTDQTPANSDPEPGTESAEPGNGSVKTTVGKAPDIDLQIEGSLLGKLATLVWWMNPVLTLVAIAGVGLLLWRSMQAPTPPVMQITNPENPQQTQPAPGSNQVESVEAPKPEIDKTKPPVTENTLPEPAQSGTSLAELQKMAEVVGQYKELLEAFSNNQEQVKLREWLSYNKAALAESRQQLEEGQRNLAEDQEKFKQARADFDKFIAGQKERAAWLKGENPLIAAAIDVAREAHQTWLNEFADSQAQTLRQLDSRLSLIAQRSFAPGGQPVEPEVVTIVIPYITSTKIEQRVLGIVQEMDTEFDRWEQLTGAVEIRVVGIENKTSQPIRFKGIKGPFLEQFAVQNDTGLQPSWDKFPHLQEDKYPGRLVLVVPLFPGTLAINEKELPLPPKRRVDVLLISMNSPTELFENNKNPAIAGALQKWQLNVAQEGGTLHLICLDGKKGPDGKNDPALAPILNPDEQIRNYFRRAIIPENLVFKAPAGEP